MDRPSGQQPKVETVVFLGLKSTGPNGTVPPNDINILELSLVAVARELLVHPLTYSDKLTFCVKPWNAAARQAAQSNGVKQLALESFRPFSEVAYTIEKFLYTLQQPICFVAHNGDKFDFPLLRAEFKHGCPGIDLTAFFCCDSLPAFRKILGNAADRQEVAELTKLRELGPDFWEAFDASMSDEEEPLSRPVDSTPQKGASWFQGNNPTPPAPKKRRPDSGVTGNHSQLQHRPAARKLFASDVGPGTASSSDSPSAQHSNGRKANGNNGVSHTLSQIGSVSVSPRCVTTPPSFTGSGKSVNNMRDMEFGLDSVYRRVTGTEMPAVREAEADCRALAETCAHLHRPFLEYVDAERSMFEFVDAMW